MKDSCLLGGVLALLPSLLFGAPQKESTAFQALKMQYEDLSLSQKHLKVENELIGERIQSLQEELTELKKEAIAQGKAGKEANKESAQLIEKRVSHLEKSADLLKGELKALSKELDRQAKTQDEKWLSLEKQFAADMKGLKQSLQTAIALLKPEEAPSSPDNYYIVKPGDSLGKIALEQKIDLKLLRSLNNLSTDRIFVGQKLRIS